MKSFSILVVVFISTVSTHVADATTGESDVIRIFDPKVKITPEKLKDILSKAQLELAGFTKYEETSYETGENGKRIVKKITYYIVKDECSQRSKWDRILRQRLPKEFYDPVLEKKMAEELQARINNRETEYCRFGLEIHLNKCGEEEIEQERSTWSFRNRRRRGIIGACVGSCSCCTYCKSTDIKYTNIDYSGPKISIPSWR